jgi:NAD-dependent DNA ligase
VRKDEDMVSHKVRQILRSMGAPFDEEEMEYMSDQEGWDWIYATRPPKPIDNRPEICFTGFKASRKAELQAIAKDNDFRCVTRVTKNLAFLCSGDDPGSTKIKEATKQGVPIISEEQFIAKITGRSL